MLLTEQSCDLYFCYVIQLYLCILLKEVMCKLCWLTASQVYVDHSYKTSKKNSPVLIWSSPARNYSVIFSTFLNVCKVFTQVGSEGVILCRLVQLYFFWHSEISQANKWTLCLQNQIRKALINFTEISLLYVNKTEELGKNEGLG